MFRIPSFKSYNLAIFITCIVLEYKMSNFKNRVRKFYKLKFIVCKTKIIYLNTVHIIGDFKLTNLIVHERFATSFPHSAWNGNFSKLIVLECTWFDRFQTFFKRNLSNFWVLESRIFDDKFHISLRECYRIYFKIFKRIFLNSFYLLNFTINSHFFWNNQIRILC